MFRKLKKPYIIAEVGSNHNGNFKNCYKAINSAKKSGADCIKFQLYDENYLAHPKLKTLNYIKNNSFKYQRDRFKSLKLNINLIKKLFIYSKKKKIDFCITPFHESFVDELKNYVTYFKIASGDLNYYPLLDKIKKSGKYAVLSTGMSSYKDIANAIKKLNKKKLALLHCIASYPTPQNSLNLDNIRHLKKEFKLPTGFSDHSEGIEASFFSIFFGSIIIEKHFLPSDKTSRVADQLLSITPTQMKNLKNRIDKYFCFIGKKKENILSSEKYFSKNLKRSLYYNKNLKKNDFIKKDSIIFLRPFNRKGIPIEDYKKILNKKLKKDVKKLKLICKNHLS